MSTVIPASPSPQLQTVLRHVDGLNTGNLDLITGDFTDDWQFHLFPRSLNGPILGKEEWSGHYTSTVKPLLKDVVVSPQLHFHSPA
jgi:hypothetical protein